MRTIVLDEYETAPISLDHSELSQLRAAAGRALAITPAEGLDEWTLRAGSLVGTVVTPAARVLIRPKVTAANLFYMLEAGGNPLAVGPEVFEYAETGDLVPAFATLYARTLERALARGVTRRYHEIAERLAGVRGRVDLAGHVRAGGLPLPVECTFDEYSADTQLNRIVAAATSRLYRLSGVARETRQALLRGLATLEETGPITRGDLSQSTVFTRLDEHFRQVERLARVVLAGAGLLDEHGTAGTGTFVVDMNVVFEEFVEANLRRHLRGRRPVRRQVTTPLDRDHYVRMRPDIVVGSAALPDYVADTKYKLTADGYGRETDYYQILAYCTALDLSEGMLIYCQHDGSTPVREVDVRGSVPRRLVTTALRLDGSPARLDEQIRTLADEIDERSWAVAAPGDSTFGSDSNPVRPSQVGTSGALTRRDRGSRGGRRRREGCTRSAGRGGVFVSARFPRRTFLSQSYAFL